MSECKERSGFLFSHACDWPATAQCKSCAKAVCSNHVRQVDADHFCIACMKKQMEKAGATPDQGAQGLQGVQGAQGIQEGQQGAMYSRAYRGRNYYDDPYWYGSYHYPYYYHHHYYDTDDHRSFDRRRTSSAEDMEGDALGS